LKTPFQRIIWYNLFWI